MRSLALVFFLILSSVMFCAETAEVVATKSADQWLALVDGGDYLASWNAAAPAFKKVVTKEQWAQAMQGTRVPLGKVLSRNVKSATYATSLPGAPDGQYVVIQYQSSFENKKTAIETITPVLGADGQWRVSGYYIR